MFLSIYDLTVFSPDLDLAKAAQMIDDAEALACLAAPCLSDQENLSELEIGAIRAILRGAILRWADAGTGAFQQRSATAGPFSESQTYDTRQQRRNMFWPSEITQLQNICGGRAKATAFGVDTVSHGWAPVHSDFCSIYFGATCSCAASLSGDLPLYEV